MVSRAAIAVAVAAVAAAAAAGCQGRKPEGQRVETGGRAADAGGAGSDAAPGAGSGSGSGSGADSAGAGAGTAKAAPDEPEAPDPSKQIADLGAIPAWQAVVDRAQLLARRGQKGIVHGRVGPAVVLPAPVPAPAPGAAGGAALVDGGVVTDGGAADAGAAAEPGAAAASGASASPYVWLVDDTEGNGSLGIRLALGKLSAKEGDRIAVSGAWVLDEARRWYWKAEAVQPLAPAPAPPSPASAPADPPPPVPSHVPATAGFPPNVRPIKQAKDNDAVYFQLTGALPAREGDGWLIAGQFGEPPVALLILPGERPSYGGQDLRSPDERWQLRRQQTYWVRIGKVRPQGAGKPFLVNARTAPIRVQ